VATDTCYQGSPPTSLEPIVCGAGSSKTSITGVTGSSLVLYSVIRLDAGARLTLPITHTHDDFYGADPAISTTTGEVTAATDILCSGGAPDILATPASVPAGGPWPGSNWDGYDFTRIADSNDPLPPADAYVDVIRPQPASFTFASSDLATLTHLWLASAALFPLPDATKLNLAAFNSAYGPYRSSVALLGGDPSVPPTDGYTCLDSPQHSVGTTGTGAGLVIPPDGSYVRYTMFTSAVDVVDGSVARILDADCVGVNVVAACDMSDADGDLVPAAVEATQGSLPGDDNSDSDDADDYDELFQFTNPTNPDTDGDLSEDLQDNTADEGTGTDIDDTTNDDNCPADSNGSQTNTDLADWSVAPAPADSTMPASDGEGDACDTDDDNDGATDVAEAGMTIVTWSGNTDPGGAGDAADTTTCKGPGVGGAPSVTISSTNPDSDMDGYSDGLECTMSARPDEDDTAVASCTTAPVDPDGCARIERSGVTDPDADKLYHPTSGLGHGAVEAFYRTRDINLDEVAREHDADGDGLDGDADKDSDNDLIDDGPEVWGWRTDASNEDTDHDACTDGKEAADVSGNRVVGAQDLGIVASTTTYGTIGGSYRNSGGIIPAQYHKLNADQNRNFIVSAQDLGLIAAQVLIGGGSCNVPTIDPNPAPGNASANAQRGLVITNQLAP
jgi:hypothetical protein